MLNNFSFKILRFTICFLFFLLFFTFYFQFRLSVLVKKLKKFLCFFILWIKDIIKEFWEIIEYFSKKYRHLKFKIHHKFYRLLFFFYDFGDLFFPFHLSKLVKKLKKIVRCFIVRIVDFIREFLNIY